MPNYLINSEADFERLSSDQIIQLLSVEKWVLDSPYDELINRQNLKDNFIKSIINGLNLTIIDEQISSLPDNFNPQEGF